MGARAPPRPAGEVPERSNGAVSKTVVPFAGDRGFESLPLRHAGTGPRTPGDAGGGGQRLEQIAFRADDADLAVGDLDPLGECTEMLATIAAAVDPDRLARRPGERLDHLRRD
jgi:hypothetical protein